MTLPDTTDGLDIADLRFSYQDWSVTFNFTLPRASLCAVIGASGSGKSTLLNLIAGFERPTAGIIRFAGSDITGLAPADRPITMVFQDNNVFPHLDVETNVALGISPALKLTGKDRAQVATALARVGLAGKANRLPGQLSGGERQRVALARVIVRARPLLLLDEPFAALGPALRADMLDLLAEICTANAMTALLVTHQPEDARRIASHTAFVHDGQIAAAGETGALFARTDLPALRAYLGA